MDTPASECWSFKYTWNGAVYSQEIPAPSREEAESRLRALASATCEGTIYPAEVASAEKPRPSA